MASHHKAKGISANLSPPSTKPADQGAGMVPENLYHTTLTVIDHHATTCGATTCLQVLGTHTTLKDAKAFAYHGALRSLNYQPYDFAIYATRENFGMPPPPPQKKGQVPTAEAVAAAVAAATKTQKPTTAAAKLAAEELENESGYSTSTGTSDTENGGEPPEVWPYGDEVLVYAKARAGGQEFLIGVVEKPNTEHLASAGPMYGNVPLLPKSHKTKTTTALPRSKLKSSKQPPLGAAAGLEAEAESDETEEELSYVIQTKTDYNQALAPGEPDELEEPEPEPPTGAGARRRSSSITRLFQACEIEGCFPHKRDAVDFARRWLDTQKESGMFVQYDEREQLPRSFFLRALPTDQQRQQQQEEEEEEEEEDTQQWPFGEDVLVHAVASTGENYCVAVGTVKGAKERFGKKVPRRGGREMDSMEVEMNMEVPRELVREEGMEETMKGREEKWRMSYDEDVPTKIGT